MLIATIQSGFLGWNWNARILGITAMNLNAQSCKIQTIVFTISILAAYDKKVVAFPG
jgi:hypothetical protein